MNYSILQNANGYYVAARVPMNNLPGCNMFFWQQVSDYYQRKGWAKRVCERLQSAKND